MKKLNQKKLKTVKGGDSGALGYIIGMIGSALGGDSGSGSGSGWGSGSGGSSGGGGGQDYNGTRSNR